MAKKEEVVVWASRELNSNRVNFYPQKPTLRKEDGHTFFDARDDEEDCSLTTGNISVVEFGYVFGPISIVQLGLVKLTITAERTE